MNKPLDRSVPVDVVVPAGARAIGLGHGRYTLVDEADYPLMSQSLWVVMLGKKRPDGTRYGSHVQLVYHDMAGKKRCMLLHRALLPEAKIVDHINGNGLDNRRSNLRACTQRENAANFKSKRPASGYFGVYLYQGKYSAQTQIGGKKQHLGRFDTAEQAAVARDIAALREYGAFATLNFPISNYLESMSKGGAL